MLTYLLEETPLTISVAMLMSVF